MRKETIQICVLNLQIYMLGRDAFAKGATLKVIFARTVANLKFVKVPAIK